jgi:hypothetical protein
MLRLPMLVNIYTAESGGLAPHPPRWTAWVSASALHSQGSLSTLANSPRPQYWPNEILEHKS